MADEWMTFGEFHFAVGSGALSRDGAALPLGRRAASLLGLLLARRGDSVSKADLMEAAWPGLSVEESNLTVQIAALRRTLGPARSGQDWIKTVPRLGYRFLSELEAETAGPATTEVNPASVAVLPFVSADAEQDYFARGLADDLITDLSKVPGLTVIARNSSFTYADPLMDRQTIARKLGVRYLIDANVRREGGRVRINAQIIDAADLRHIWADRFDGDMSDVFSLQDEVTRRIVEALALALPADDRQQEPRRVNLEAYDLFARGRSLVLQSPDGFRAGRELLEQASALDPAFADAQAWLAMSHVHAWYNWGLLPTGLQHPMAIAAGRRAIGLDPGNATGHAYLGFLLIFTGEEEEGARELARALAIDPNAADAWMLQAEVHSQFGDHQAAMTDAARAFALNPLPPPWYHWIRGFIEYAAGAYDAAIDTLSHRSVRRTGAQRLLAAALARVGRIEEAREEARQFMQGSPTFRISEWSRSQPMRDETTRLHFVEAYRLAGLPE